MDPMTVKRLIQELKEFESDALVKVYDATLKEISHIDKIITKHTDKGVDVVLVTRENHNVIN